MSKRIRDLCITTQIVIPAQAGIQNLLKLLDSPVSSTEQAQSRASLEFIRRMPDGMTKLLVLCSYAKLSIYDKGSCLDKPIAQSGSTPPPIILT